MYAIVDIKDKQFKVEEDDTLYVPHHADAEEDQELTFDRVLLVSDGDGEVTLGTPTVEDASVTARVREHVKGDKVIVFKKKRRKRYRVKRGHRQQYTQIEIESLNANGAAETTSADDTAEDDASEDEAEAEDAGEVEDEDAGEVEDEDAGEVEDEDADEAEASEEDADEEDTTEDE